jgi:hypothetical protein
MNDDHELEAELRALGRTLTVEPVPDDLADRVLARVPVRPVHPARRLLRRIVLDVKSRRRLVAVIIAALIAALLLASPVRAAVIEWLRVGGIVFQSAPAPSPGPTSRPSRTGAPVMIEVDTVDRARTMIDFPIGLPTELGPPTRVAVSADRRLVELEFATDAGPIVISQFDGSMIIFVKRDWDRLNRVEVNGELAIWLPDPHTISYVDPDGVEHTDEARLSGPTLAYETHPAGTAHPVTVRLEGPFTQPRAITIAESLRFP